MMKKNVKKEYLLGLEGLKYFVQPREPDVYDPLELFSVMGQM